MWLPLFQMVFHLVESGGLKGAFVPHAKPELSDSSWFNGDYQKQYEQYLNDTVGFHQDLVRLRNQIDFSLFDKCHSYDIEVGKQGYLIATTHIDYHLGKNHERPSKIDSTVNMLKQLNDTLTKMNKSLILIFAPSRGAFYKELAPSWYDLTPAHESDYQHYIKSLSGTKINYIDFNAAFLQKKETSKYPLFTKCGIHWSNYGGAIAADSMVKYIEKLRGVDLPDIKFSKIEQSKKARGADADLNSTLNLIWPVKNNLMAYPKLRFNRVNKQKLKLLTIGDSFYFVVLESEVPVEAFDEHSFWYYNGSISSNGPNAWKSVGDLSLVSEIRKHDVITLIATETNLGNLGWGFIEQAWQAFCTPSGARLIYYIDKIKNDSVWLQQIKDKAKQSNKNVDLQIQQDANYAVGLENQKK